MHGSELAPPLGRWAEPSELGSAVVFLASNASNFGQVIYIDVAVRLHPFRAKPVQTESVFRSIFLV
jgi:hypothetical protein